MAPKRNRKSVADQQMKRKRIPPTLSPEEKKKRAQQRATLHKELAEMSKAFQDPNSILLLQPLRTGQEPSPSPPTENVESWCKCGKCFALPTAEECVCCQDIHNVTQKLEDDTALSCITDHNMFRDTCLNKEQLTICEMYRSFGKTQTAPMDNRTLRKASYRMFTMWVHGYLGPKKRRPIPACAVHKVREAFPQENLIYVGFHKANDYCAADMADDM